MIAQTFACTKTTSPTAFEAALLIADSVSAQILAADSTSSSPTGTQMSPTTLMEDTFTALADSFTVLDTASAIKSIK